tara:strand:- start:1437 stop:1859 length:423 start_codon:yes stop_codon:yes gene_type:complete
MRIALFTATVILFAGCSGNEKRVRPAGVLSADSMVLVLAEVQIINAKVTHRESRRKKFTDILKVEQLAMYDSIGVTQSQIDASMAFYAEDYGEMQKMHDKAMNLLTERMARLKTEKPELIGAEKEDLEITKSADDIRHLE